MPPSPGHDYCSAERCQLGCDQCGAEFAKPTRVCPSCGSLTCEMEAMFVGDAAEARGEDREKAVSPDWDEAEARPVGCCWCCQLPITGEPIRTRGTAVCSTACQRATEEAIAP